MRPLTQKLYFFCRYLFFQLIVVYYILKCQFTLTFNFALPLTSYSAVSYSFLCCACNDCHLMFCLACKVFSLSKFTTAFKLILLMNIGLICMMTLHSNSNRFQKGILGGLIRKPIRNIMQIGVKELGRTWFSFGWQGCSSGFPSSSALRKSLLFNIN